MTIQKRSPKKTKSTRRPCPISIDCELVAAKRRKVCPNRNYCESLAIPWALQYSISHLADGTRILKVDTHATPTDNGSRNFEQYKSGWCEAIPLPFYYVTLPDIPKPIIYVRAWFIHENTDWREGKRLGQRYWEWAAVKRGISYLDYYNRSFYDDIHWKGYLFEPLTPAYPHCILPPNY